MNKDIEELKIAIHKQIESMQTIMNCLVRLLRDFEKRLIELEEYKSKTKRN